jgi:hypothetical protein
VSNFQLENYTTANLRDDFLSDPLFSAVNSLAIPDGKMKMSRSGNLKW